MILLQLLLKQGNDQKTIETRWNSMVVSYKRKVNSKAFVIPILTHLEGCSYTG